VLAYFGPPDLLAEADEVHVDCTFTYDKPAAERLAEQWRCVAPVKLGGVAYGDRGEEFVPGRYIKLGYGFTSRGCPRRCWFCSVWKRDPVPRLLPVVDCWNILDDNLLACPRDHVEAAFAMLRRQKRPVEFTGGLEARALEDYQVGLLADLRPRPNMFFAYDPGDDFETLEHAARRLLAAGFTTASHRMRCYVLTGFPRDTFALAEARLQQMLSIGFTPMAMLWRPGPTYIAVIADELAFWYVDTGYANPDVEILNAVVLRTQSDPEAADGEPNRRCVGKPRRSPG
jgi:hypothetical protein